MEARDYHALYSLTWIASFQVFSENDSNHYFQVVESLTYHKLVLPFRSPFDVLG